MAYRQASSTNSRLMTALESFLDDNIEDISPNLFTELDNLMMEMDESAEELEDKLRETENEASELTDRVEELEKEVEELNDRL